MVPSKYNNDITPLLYDRKKICIKYTQGFRVDKGCESEVELINSIIVYRGDSIVSCIGMRTLGFLPRFLGLVGGL